MKVVGLIGGVASGKSTVAAEFVRLGARVLDADKMAHALLDDPAVQEQVRAKLGSDVFDENNRVDRRKLGKLVFGTDAATASRRRTLEQILHPAVRLASEQQLSIWHSEGCKLAVIDAPLLLEAGWRPMCDVVLFIDTPLDLRRQWASQRGWDESELTRREDSQWSLHDKKDQATHVVTNHGSIDELRRQVEQIAQQLASE